MFQYDGQICIIIKYNATIEFKCQIHTILHFTFNLYTLNLVLLISSVGGIAVSIAAFQAVDPGSTPGHRNNFLLKSFMEIIQISE